MSDYFFLRYRLSFVIHRRRKKRMGAKCWEKERQIDRDKEQFFTRIFKKDRYKIDSIIGRKMNLPYLRLFEIILRFSSTSHKRKKSIKIRKLVRVFSRFCFTSSCTRNSSSISSSSSNSKQVYVIRECLPFFYIKRSNLIYVEINMPLDVPPSIRSRIYNFDWHHGRVDKRITRSVWLKR